MQNKTAMIVIGIVVVLLLGLMFDTALNWGKAYAHVSINGMSVSGMTSEDMRKALDEAYASKLASSQVTVYASEEARQRAADELAALSNEETAEEISVEDAQQRITSWTADGSTLQATLPYDQVIERALDAGRKGGPFGRIALAITGEDIPLTVVFDDEQLDTFASEIDKTIGNARVDATVVIEDGTASSVEGHDGMQVDRDWLAERLSDVILEKDGSTYIIAEATEAPSRTTKEQADYLRDAINKALTAGAVFTYHSNDWTADQYELGNWTRVDVVQKDGEYDLQASIDPNIATSAIVKHVASLASTSSNDSNGITVDFETSDNGIIVKTSGSGEVPEVVPAIESVNEALYGNQGIAWSAATDPDSISIEIGESNAPETLGFEQAVDLGIICVIGEYTTEFSNEEGTENRNHNIKLVADILNDTICESNGGEWSFNSHTGDTNLDPPFASAGSIVNGEYVDSIGGGICQVATTVFNAVYEAGLDVVQRRNHSLYIGSYPTGRDVGVSYPELDFVWENKLDSDVLVKLSTTDTTITTQLYSVYTGFKVESSEGEWEEGEKYHTEFVVEEGLEKGDYYLKTVGEDGSKISVTRTVKDKSGAVISETVFDSVYEPKNEVYAIGPGTDTSKLARDTSEERNESEDDPYDSTSGDYDEYDDYGEGSEESDETYEELDETGYEEDTELY